MDMRELLRKTSAMLIGMTLDPAIPDHAKEAMRARVSELDEAVTDDDKPLSSAQKLLLDIKSKIAVSATVTLSVDENSSLIVSAVAKLKRERVSYSEAFSMLTLTEAKFFSEELVANKFADTFNELYLEHAK